MKILFLPIVAVMAIAVWLIRPLKVFFNFDKINAETIEGALPTGVGRPSSGLKLVLTVVFTLLSTAVIGVASWPMLGAIGPITVLVVAVLLLRRFGHQIYDSAVDKLVAAGLAWRRSGAAPSAFA